MPEISRSQLVAYAAFAILVVALGVRFMHRQQPAAAPVSSGTAERSAATGGVSVARPAPAESVVHVAGAVRQPGVYRLPAGARVTDAVERAGGPAPKAVVDAINLAARLADGQQVIVPEAGPGGSVSSAGTSAEDGPISLGTATVEQLDTIEGIGPVTAQQIVEFRDSHGGLSSVDQLDQISGIGPATMDALRARIQP